MSLRSLLYFLDQSLIHSFPPWGSEKFELPCDVFSHKVVLQPLALPYLLHPACGGLEYRGVVCNIVARDFHSGNERIQFSLKLFNRRFQPHHSRDRTTEEQNVALASLLRGNLSTQVDQRNVISLSRKVDHLLSESSAFQLLLWIRKA